MNITIGRKNSADNALPTYVMYRKDTTSDVAVPPATKQVVKGHGFHRHDQN